jgi:AcrR family transcriptional regulator
VEQVVIDAVLDLIGQGSTLTSLSLVSIARHACISRNSLYRRWTTKEELYVDVVKSLGRPEFDSAEQSARESLVKLLTEELAGAAVERIRRLYRAINAEAESFPELFDHFVLKVVTPLRETIKRIIRRGKEAGEIRVDVDENVLTDVLISSVVVHTLAGPTGNLDRSSTSRLITDLAFDGAAPH